MLSINEILAVKPQFILSVDYNAGSISEDKDLSKYLAELTIQHYSLLDGACLSFTIECLISVIDELVVIEEMNTSSDRQSVYANNIDGLIEGHVTIGEYGCIDVDYHDMLQSLIENQPIYDAPNNFIIEDY